jgi:hypothetical protein
MPSVVRCAVVATQRRGKRISVAMNQHSTVEELLETVFSTRFIPREPVWRRVRIPPL